jgi:PEP-CTERM motif
MKTASALRCLLFGFALTVAVPAHALTMLTFEDGEFAGPVFESIHPAGVTFSVTPLSFDATSDYGAEAFAGLSFVTRQTLEIAADHVLELTFAAPVSFIQFGVAHNQPDIFGDFVPVTLFTVGGSTTDDSFSIFAGLGGMGETLYTYMAPSAGGAVTGLSIAFPPLFAAAGNKYQIDNLTFEIAAVPEPAVYAMVMAGLLLIGCNSLRRRPGSGI